MTHNLCGTCNRLRITSDGNLKACLFGNAESSLRDILRQSNNGRPIDEEAFEAIKPIEMDGSQGLSVKSKKAKHGGMGELEKIPNMPMILIGG